VNSVKDDKFFGVGTGMGLRKTDTELKAALNKAFDEHASKTAPTTSLRRNTSTLTYTAANCPLCDVPQGAVRRSLRFWRGRSLACGGIH
jgi:hypothetical protein